jgi:hypothetical protein
MEKNKKHTSIFFGAPENHCKKPLDPTKPQTPKQKQQQQQQQQQEKKEQNRTEAERDNKNTSIAILSSSEPMAANVIPVSPKKKKEDSFFSVYFFCLCCFSLLSLL